MAFCVPTEISHLSVRYRIKLAVFSHLSERTWITTHSVECAVIKREIKSRLESCVPATTIIITKTFLCSRGGNCVCLCENGEASVWVSHDRELNFYNITNNMDQMINDDMTRWDGKRPKDKTKQCKQKTKCRFMIRVSPYDSHLTSAQQRQQQQR